MTFRIGVFFLFLGLISMAVYFASDFAGSPAFLLFFASLALIFLGIYLMRKGYVKPPPSDRFKTYRKLRKKDNEEENL